MKSTNTKRRSLKLKQKPLSTHWIMRTPVLIRLLLNPWNYVLKALVQNKCHLITKILFIPGNFC